MTWLATTEKSITIAVICMLVVAFLLVNTLESIDVNKCMSKGFTKAYCIRNFQPS